MLGLTRSLALAEVLGLTRSLALAPFGPKDAVGGRHVGTGHDSVAPWSGHVVAQFESDATLRAHGPGGQKSGEVST